MHSGFRISPTAVHREPVSGRSVWTARDFSGGEWNYRLRPETLDEIDRGIASGSPDFPLDSFERDADRLRAEVKSGRGFVVLKGLPVDRYSNQDAVRAYLRIAALFGHQLPQNVKLDQVYSVRDEGYSIEKQYGTVGVRFSKTTSGLNFHTDSAPVLLGNTPDIVGLLALQVARKGGASAIVSAGAVHNALLRDNPEALERLYQPFHFDRRAELREGEPSTLFAPVFTYNGSLAVRYFGFYIPKGHEIAGAPLTDRDVAALEALEAAMQPPELAVTFEMERGDIQLINNNFILHSRTAFEDHPEPERRRHLIRLWLKHC